jgi:uncharacterized protein (TIGR02246 family)
MPRHLSGGLLFCLLCASPALAQGNPNDFRRPGPAADRAAYYARVRIELNELMIRWKRAWESDDAVALGNFYAADASYYPLHAAPLITRSSIQGYFAKTLATMADVNTQIIDFGMSGDMAYVTARVIQYERTNVGGVNPVPTIQIFIFRRNRDGAWEIQTHLAAAAVG